MKASNQIIKNMLYMLPHACYAGSPITILGSQMIEVENQIQRDERQCMTSMLFIACERGWSQLADELLVLGVDPNVVGSDGNTPLIVAAQNGQDDTVSVLLAREAVVQSTNRHGMTALHLAADNGHSEVVEKLIDAGADVNAAGTHGLTALHLAIDRGHALTVGLLLKRGASPGATTRRGLTAEMLGRNSRNAEMAELFGEDTGRPKGSFSR